MFDKAARDGLGVVGVVGEGARGLFRLRPPDTSQALHIVRRAGPAVVLWCVLAGFAVGVGVSRVTVVLPAEHEVRWLLAEVFVDTAAPLLVAAVLLLRWVPGEAVRIATRHLEGRNVDPAVHMLAVPALSVVSWLYFLSAMFVPPVLGFIAMGRTDPLTFLVNLRVHVSGLDALRGIGLAIVCGYLLAAVTVQAGRRESPTDAAPTAILHGMVALVVVACVRIFALVLEAL